MAAFFKISCAFFWLILLVNVSFFFTIGHLTRTDTILRSYSSFPYLYYLVMATCLVTQISTYVGCCSIKTEVTSLTWGLSYIIYTLVGIILLCTLILLQLRSNYSILHLNDTAIYEIVLKDFQKLKKIPLYLFRAQLNRNCCGLLGVKDYASIFKRDDRMQNRLPKSCCVERIDRDMLCPSKNSSIPDKESLTDIFLDLTLPRNFKLNPTTIDNKTIALLYGDESQGPEERRYLFQNLTLPINLAKAANFNLKGCLGYLKTGTEDVLDLYYIYAVVMICFAILMILLYTHQCCKARKLKNEYSESGDTEAGENEENANGEGDKPKKKHKLEYKIPLTGTIGRILRGSGQGNTLKTAQQRLSH